jgi:hypothetical protein
MPLQLESLGLFVTVREEGIFAIPTVRVFKQSRVATENVDINDDIRLRQALHCHCISFMPIKVSFSFILK